MADEQDDAARPAGPEGGPEHDPKDRTEHGPEPGPPGRSRDRDLRRPLSSDAMPESVACPFCDGVDTEQFSAFGSAVSVGHYYCRSCRTVFEWMKWR